MTEQETTRTDNSTATLTAALAINNAKWSVLTNVLATGISLFFGGYLVLVGISQHFPLVVASGAWCLGVCLGTLSRLWAPLKLIIKKE